ncbi:hypothetical protein X945_586 [Burkholderia pseudomallei ABCPW 107]|nr:hypothetical protein X945_586 [Burkholderia pseudomallei ABCPW 107]
MHFEVGACRRPINAFCINEPGGKVGCVEKLYRHDDFNPLRQGEFGQPPVIDSLEGFFQPRERGLPGRRVVPNVPRIATVQFHAGKNFDHDLSRRLIALSHFFRIVTSNRFTLNFFLPEPQSRHVPDSPLDFPRNTLTVGLGCVDVIAPALRACMTDVVGKIGNMLANLFIRAWLHCDAVLRASLKMHFAHCDTTSTGFEHGLRWSIPFLYFKPRHPADCSRFADANAADERNLVLPFLHQARQILQLLLVLIEPSLERAGDIVRCRKRAQLLSCEFCFPQKLLLRVVKGRLRQDLPLSLDALSKLERFIRPDGLQHFFEFIGAQFAFTALNSGENRGAPGDFACKFRLLQSHLVSKTSQMMPDSHRSQRWSCHVAPRSCVGAPLYQPIFVAATFLPSQETLLHSFLRSAARPFGPLRKRDTGGRRHEDGVRRVTSCRPR